VTNHLKKSGKVKKFQSGQGNVKGNCFRPTPLSKIGGINFFMIASIAHYLYLPLLNWWRHSWLKSIVWSSWGSTSQSPWCIVESLPAVLEKSKFYVLTRSTYWMIAWM